MNHPPNRAKLIEVVGSIIFLISVAGLMWLGLALAP